MNTRAALGEGAGMCVSGAGLRRSSLSKNVTAMLSGRATGGAASEHSAIHAEYAPSIRTESGRIPDHRELDIRTTAAVPSPLPLKGPPCCCPVHVRFLPPAPFYGGLPGRNRIRPDFAKIA